MPTRVWAKRGTCPSSPRSLSLTPVSSCPQNGQRIAYPPSMQRIAYLS